MPEFALVAVLLVLGIGAYWSMVVFPRQRDFQERQRYVRSLSSGDEVITFGGIVGTVVEVDSERGIALVEIADGVVIRLITAALMQAYDVDTIAENAQMGVPEKINKEG